MITFNDILLAEGINPATVKLVRHQEGGRRGMIVYATSRQPDGRTKVEEYQRVQSRKVFDVGGLAEAARGVSLAQVLAVTQVTAVGGPAGAFGPRSDGAGG